MLRPILLFVGLALLGACAAENEKPKDLVNGGAGNPATGGTTMMTSSGGAGGGGKAATGGNGGNAAAGSGGAIGAGGTTAGTGGAAMAGAGGAGGIGSGGTGTGGMGAGGAGGATGSGGATGGNTAGTVTVTFTTISPGGQYAPKNYVAVWFEAKGMFIKTAARWAGAAHATDLYNWTEASGGWGVPFLGGGNMADMMDAMSSATLQSHDARTVMWNMMDAQKKLVADGDYEAVVEMSEDRAGAQAAQVLRIPFTKGTQPQTVDVPDNEGFKDVTLTYTP